MDTQYLDGVFSTVTSYQSKLSETLASLKRATIQEDKETTVATVEDILDSKTIETNDKLTTTSISNESNQKTNDQIGGEQLSINDSIFRISSLDKENSSIQELPLDNTNFSENEQNVTDLLGIFSSYSETSIRDVVKILSYSLLSGEFLTIEKFEEKITLLIQQTQQLITEAEDSIHITAALLNFTNSIIYCLDEYRRFLQYLFANFSKNRSEDYFQIEDESIDTIPDLPDELQNVIRLFKLVLKVSRKDLLINSDPSELRNLALLAHQVEKLKNVQQSVAFALEIKLEFLIHKWDQRYKRKNPESSIKYRIGNTEKSLNGLKNNISKIEEWNNKIYYHYDFCTDSNKYGYYIHDALIKKRKGYSNLSLLELHGLIKFYKDFSKSESELKSIVEYLLDTDFSDRHNYDQYCIEIIRNYAINNYFSLISENKSHNLDKYQEIYLDCKSKLNHLSNNYFLQMKYLEYVLERIDDEYSKSLKENLISVNKKYARKIGEECSSILDEYYVKKEWAKSHDNYIVILPYEESLVDVSSIDKDLPKILFFTSFVLPDYKDSIDFNYSKIRQKFREVKALTSVVHSLKGDLQKLEELNKEFDKKDLKSIEIISLFTAIITFVLSSIPAFKFVETVYQASLFMLSMAASLGIFILLIFSFTRGFSNFFSKQRNWLVFLVIVFLFIVTSFSLISFENKSVNGILEKSVPNRIEKNSIDSLKKDLGIHTKE
ncbi:hypothetical protein FAZ19_07225 [Sphingobacterium alkalisoli]|uniref:Uncharacterized protein n=1 Tax=Sphingobacterium alkalisoli TaxID=1874115 RepID=A0A4U0H8E3_9SPHI|nr:hypothetical protein [Sphingobacterium alkalisoli]TJY66702.1 hypothetical protein FAZ19_07225 [Sphingobacterium alkalisoli]GGH14715.1 hypothetical protein GCM10011418_15870 [Sphingobacterium alkalisoli]